MVYLLPGVAIILGLTSLVSCSALGVPPSTVNQPVGGGELEEAPTPVLSLEDQVRLLTKQLNALTNQRREDYKSLENNLKKYVRKNSAQLTGAEIREELDALR